MDQYAQPHIIPFPKKMSFKDNETVNISEFSVKCSEKKFKDMYERPLRLLERQKAKKLFLVNNDRIIEEGYKLNISSEKITVEASSEKGFFYCLQTLLQLKNGDKIPVTDIDDYPSLKMRGIHLNFDNVRNMGYREAHNLILMLAKFKINTILIEYGDRFPYKKHPLVVSSNTLSKAEIRKLISLARENYIEVIPLLQSFGHLDYVLDVHKYQYLNEGEKEGGRQLCPSNLDSLKLFVELAEEIIEIHPDIRYFHIGGDETRYLGYCPVCKERAKSIGKGGLYIEHINKVCRWIKKQGLIPILWDDMLCTFPETVQKLEKGSIIMYWDYWATEDSTPLLLARSYETNRGVVYDRRWQNEWAKEITGLEKENTLKFGRFMNLEKELEPEYKSKFLPYLGDKFPKYIKAFPYLKFYKDSGFEVIGAPLLDHLFADTYDWKWLLSVQRPVRNIFAFTKRCIEEGALGIVGTSWRNYPVEVIYHGIITTAQFSWAGG
ncbi:MAG: beta-N-acetylhexosaminidase [Candidatus Omnitrophica bacterium]|nr:beta-N-acetylhexosaminidase [Candidatus Omnitrophota bacterium]